MEIREPVDLGYHATIVATAHDWKLVFTLPGPDGRYSPSIVLVHPNELVYFGQHLSDALDKYLTLKNVMNSKSEVEDTVGYVTMHVGGHFDGVCIGRYRRLLKTKDELRHCLAVLSAIPARGEELVAGLKKVGALGSQKLRSPQ